MLKSNLFSTLNQTQKTHQLQNLYKTQSRSYLIKRVKAIKAVTKANIPNISNLSNKVLINILVNFSLFNQ